MLEIKVTIACPDLPLAASTLAAVINHRSSMAAATDPAPIQKPVSAPAPMPFIPAAPQTPAIPSAAPATIVPTAPAPTYSIDQIAKAGADLVQAGKMNELMALLQQFGIQAVTQLRPDQLGPFATALRGLGANL